MRFLISNYSTPWFTEPYYFNTALNLLDGETSVMFDNQRSVYDNFDNVKPDVFITHSSQINNDVIHYIKSNSRIKLVINVNGIDNNNISKIVDFLQLANIDFALFGCNELDKPEAKFIRIPEAADIFLHYIDNEYRIEQLIFIEKPEDIIENTGTCHYTSNKEELANVVDFMLPINGLTSIFKNYDEIVFKGSSFIGSQISFNAIYSGTKVIFDTKDHNSIDKIDSIFKNQKLLTSVKNKHTCLHRLKSLMSQISCHEIAQKIENKINTI